MLFIAGIAEWFALPVIAAAAYPSRLPCACRRITYPQPAFVHVNPLLVFLYAIYVILMIASGVIGFVLIITGAAKGR